jgi:hypothetical protein
MWRAGFGRGFGPWSFCEHTFYVSWKWAQSIVLVFCIQASLVLRDFTLRVFAIMRFRGEKSRKKIVKYNFAVTVYGGGMNVARPPAGHILPVSVWEGALS